MTNLRIKLGAVLLALAFMALPAAAASATLNAHSSHIPWGLLTSVGLLMGGTVVATWSSFVPLNPSATYTGGTTPPTAAQATQCAQQTITVSCTDADATINITHNLGIPTAQAAVFQPQLIGPYLTALGTGTTLPAITWSFSNTNVLVGTKSTNAGSGCTFNVVLRYPNP
jgi:hypothetical protein